MVELDWASSLSFRVIKHRASGRQARLLPFSARTCAVVASLTWVLQGASRLASVAFV